MTRQPNDNTELVLLGAGGGSRELIALMADANRREGGAGGWRIRGILDDNEALTGKEVSGVPVLGPLAAADRFGECRFISGIANAADPGIRLKVAERLALPPRRWATFVHPRAIVLEGSSVGPGAIVYPDAVVSANARLGAQTVAYYGAVVHHDSQVGEGCCLCAGVLIGGYTEIGPGCYLGIGARVRDHVTIGRGALIGAGAVVLEDVPPGITVVGVPARPIDRKR